MKEINIFLSYCWDDSLIADNIYDYFKNNRNIELHRDMIDIKKWGSIKEYMQSISNMDYTILLISDVYLKSANCMYEVLEVMRDRDYRDKVFPAIIHNGIYNPITRAEYVKHWEIETEKLEETLKGIKVQNLGRLPEDLKRRQDISSNIAEFLDTVADMNNPNIQEVSARIDEKLCQKGLVGTKTVKQETGNDIFAALGIQKTKFNSQPTDLEISQFVKDSFNQVIALLSELCQQYEIENPGFKIQTEQVDTRTAIFQFYQNGRLVRGLKLFLSNMLSRQESIGISDNTTLYGSNNSWSGMYMAKVVDGKLKLDATMSLMGTQKPMTVEDVVVDIWKNYIQIYLEK